MSIVNNALCPVLRTLQAWKVQILFGKWAKYQNIVAISNMKINLNILLCIVLQYYFPDDAVTNNELYASAQLCKKFAKQILID